MRGTASARHDGPIEIPTDHRCLLGALTDRLAEAAQSGVRGEQLAEQARARLRELASRDQFVTCCLPAYLALAPEQFDREIQLPIAHAAAAKLDTRVLLWPVGAADGQHPHCDGWAAFMAMRGTLMTHEERHGRRGKHRQLTLREPELIVPEQDVRHHIHNVGEEIGLTIHVFGV